MTAAQNMAFALDNAKVSQGRDRSARVAEAAKILELEDLLDRKPGACRAASASGWRWAAPSCATPRCSAWTSRCPTSTPSCACDPVADRQAPAAPRHHDGLRHARPGRGDDDGGPRRGAAGRQAAAGATRPERAVRHPSTRSSPRSSARRPSRSSSRRCAKGWRMCTGPAAARPSGRGPREDKVVVGLRPESWQSPTAAATGGEHRRESWSRWAPSPSSTAARSMGGRTSDE